MEISQEVEKKGERLFKEGNVEKRIENERRIHFKVEGRTETHSVIFDKRKNKFTCDCRFFTLKEKICSHIIACKLYLENIEKIKIKLLD